MSYVNQAMSFVGQLDQELSKYPTIVSLERRFGVPKAYGVLVGVGFYLFLIFLNIGGVGGLMTNIAGFAVPAYYSLLAIESPASEDDTQYLTYWLVFALFSLLDYFSKVILYWIPFYWLFKFFFLLYLGLPQFKGATTVYYHFVRPVASRFINLNAVRTNYRPPATRDASHTPASHVQAEAQSAAHDASIHSTSAHPRF